MNRLTAYPFHWGVAIGLVAHQNSDLMRMVNHFLADIRIDTILSSRLSDDQMKMTCQNSTCITSLSQY